MSEEKHVRAYMPHRTLQKDGSVVEGFAERDVVDALHGPTGNKEPLIVCASEACSAGSAVSTSDSTELGFDTSSSVSRILGAETCSPRGGVEFPSTTTYELWVSNQRRELRNMDVSPSLTKPGGFTQAPFLVQRTEALDTYNQTLNEVSMTLRDPNGTFGDALPAVLISTAKGVVPPEASQSISSAEASRERARTSPSPDSAAGSPANAPASSTSSHESLSLFDLDGFSSRTYPGCSPRTAVGTSESCLERWPTSGTAWRGGFSTHVSSECRSADGVCSSSEPSLTEILEPPQNVPARYSLSARAATGILRRAQKRGRTLPAHLQAALQAVAGESAQTRQP